MSIEERFVTVLEQKLAMRIPQHELVHETKWFYKSEVNANILEPAILAQLEETVITNSVYYMAADETEYELLHIWLPNETFHELWLVNGKVQKEFSKGSEVK